MARERYFSSKSLARILCSVDEAVVTEALKIRLKECPPSVDTRCMLLSYAEVLLVVLVTAFKGFTGTMLIAALRSVRLALRYYCGITF